MPALGITGGIGTGKSTFAALLRGNLGAELFDVDHCASELLESDSSIRDAVRRAFGASIYDASGVPDRKRLRDLIFADPRERKRLEEILHPAIRARWVPLAADAQGCGNWLLVDIPLLFETEAQAHFDSVVVVATSAPVQDARLRNVRGLTGELARQILAAQLDLETKIKRADYMIWNDSTLACLESQAQLLAPLLRVRYG